MAEIFQALPSRPTTSKITLARMPPCFDSHDKAKWETFGDALTTYMGAYESEFDSDKKRIFFVLSLLRAEDGTNCPASNWARNWKRTHMRYGSLNAGKTFRDFIEDLEKMFEDQNVKGIVFLRLLGTRQGKTPLADFLQAFELNAEEAGYLPSELGHDTFLCQTLEALISDEVRHQLYAGGIEIPGDYWGLKKRLTTISSILEHGKLLKNQWGQGGMFGIPLRVTPLATQNKTAGPGVATKLLRGEQAPMDVDRARQTAHPFTCYNYGKEGHMKRECLEPPKKKFNIRSIKIEDYTQDDLQALAAILREKGF
jgi:hypothetical protein